MRVWVCVRRQGVFIGLVLGELFEGSVRERFEVSWCGCGCFFFQFDVVTFVL